MRFLRSSFRCFSRNNGGASAVEFALILPFMVVLLVGSFEVTRAIDNYRKVTLLTRTVVDLTGQGDTVSPMAAATMSDILGSSTLVLTPFTTGTTTIVVSALGVYTSTLGTKPYVCSSYASNATVRKAGAVAADLTVPPQYQTTGKRYLLAEVTSTYTPIFGAALLSAIGLSSTVRYSVSMPWPPRGGAPFNSTFAEIILPSGSACPTTAS